MALKSKILASTVKSEPVPLTVPEVRENKGNSAVLALVDKAIRSAKTMVQSVTQCEPAIAAAAFATVEHFDNHGDLGPADRLMKGLQACNHPVTTTAARELAVWFRLNSPIQWDSRGKVFKNKDEAKGRLDTDLKQAEETGYFETKQALNARKVMDKAHGRSLTPVTAKMLIGRIIGSGAGFIANINSGKDERKIASGEEAKIKKIIKAVNTALLDVAADDASEAIKKVA